MLKLKALRKLGQELKLVWPANTKRKVLCNLIMDCLKEMGKLNGSRRTDHPLAKVTLTKIPDMERKSSPLRHGRAVSNIDGVQHKSDVKNQDYDLLTSKLREMETKWAARERDLVQASSLSKKEIGELRIQLDSALSESNKLRAQLGSNVSKAASASEKIIKADRARTLDIKHRVKERGDGKRDISKDFGESENQGRVKRRPATSKSQWDWDDKRRKWS